ncbi:hypothetical protein ACQCSX_02195 [Pseudarthrobacter sp. P1]|uniref:hypothetical protein n=1 Tax=Pseudarthrobacter sp. P1 TaxID=3418418 RepID=UPI003CEDF847
MNKVRKSAIGGLFLAAVIGGGALTAAALPANAADTTTATASVSSTAVAPDPSKGGHQANGITEVLLTGDAAAKATASVLAADPGATIQRVETDAEGAAYEAHILTADGSAATVKLDASFTVTSTETGGPGGAPKAAQGSNG